MNKTLLIDYMLLLLGCICMSIGVVVFFAHNHIAAGGPPGIAILVNYLSGISLGSVLLVVNLPLLIIGYKKFGKKYIFRTLIIVLGTSLLTDLFFNILSNFNVTNDRMLNALFGGALIGSGIGFMFKSGGSSGGWGILAQLISTSVQVPVGKIVFILDCIVIIFSVVVFRNLETALYGVVGIFVSGKMIDIILIGSSNIKSVHISCNSAVDLIPLITDDLSSPGSIVECKRYDDRIKKDLIFLSVKQEKIPELREIVIKQDADSYMVVHDATEVYGFKPKI